MRSSEKVTRPLSPSKKGNKNRSWRTIKDIYEKEFYIWDTLGEFSAEWLVTIAEDPNAERQEPFDDLVLMQLRST